MASTWETLMRTTITDSTGQISTLLSDNTFPLGTGDAAVDTEVTIAATTFQALTVPTGAKAVRIRPGTAVSLTLKGVTGDTGIAITPASMPAGQTVFDDVYLPLGATPSIGILNGGAGSVTLRVIFG